MNENLISNKTNKSLNLNLLLYGVVGGGDNGYGCGNGGSNGGGSHGGGGLAGDKGVGDIGVGGGYFVSGDGGGGVDISVVIRARSDKRGE